MYLIEIGQHYVNLNLQFSLFFSGTNADRQVPVMCVCGGLWHARRLRRPHDSSRQFSGGRNESVQIGHL